jgi:hypothetical protein
MYTSRYPGSVLLRITRATVTTRAGDRNGTVKYIPVLVTTAWICSFQTILYL